MQYKVGDLIKFLDHDDVYIVHKEKGTTEDDYGRYMGWIGVTCIRTGERHQTQTHYIEKIKTDKK